MEDPHEGNRADALDVGGSVTDSMAIDLERARAERRSPVLLWGLNVLWPGLGNLVVGQVIAGIVFGLVSLVFWLLMTVTMGLASPLLFLHWLVASVVGHRWINDRYTKALEAIEAKHATKGPA